MKKIKNIVLLEPMSGHLEDDVMIRDKSCISSGSPTVMREPIAIEYIAGFLISKGYSVNIVQQRDISQKELTAVILKYQPDVVGFSIHSTFIFNNALETAKEIKMKKPDIVTIFGGNHPTGYPQILLQGAIDYVVIGEGEKTIYELLKELENGNDIANIQGVAWINKNREIIINKVSERINFATLPWPLRDKDILEETKCSPLCYPIPPKQKAAAQISYSRGCSGGCTFCVSNYLWHRQVSFRNPDDVISEINYLKAEFGTNYLFLTDLTFNANKKKAMLFCESLIKSKLAINWFAYANVHLDLELAEAMKEAGCSRIGFGLESVIDIGLEKIKPNQSLQIISETLKMTSKIGILNRCYLMIGFPWETEEYLEMMKKTLFKLYIDQIRLGFVVPFPGTDLFHEWEAIRSNNFEEYTGDEPVVFNKNITKQRLLQIRDEIVFDYYNNQIYWDHVKENIKKSPHLKESYIYFKDYLVKHNLLTNKVINIDN
jgi:anaerobic magnesium-protoporphyrin IX monomethyl ester cyclase